MRVNVGGCVAEGVRVGLAVAVGVTVKVGGKTPGRRVAVEIGAFMIAVRVWSFSFTFSGFCSVSAKISPIMPNPMRGILPLDKSFE